MHGTGIIDGLTVFEMMEVIAVDGIYNSVSVDCNSKDINDRASEMVECHATVNAVYIEHILRAILQEFRSHVQEI